MRMAGRPWPTSLEDARRDVLRGHPGESPVHELVCLAGWHQGCAGAERLSWDPHDGHPQSAVDAAAQPVPLPGAADAARSPAPLPAPDRVTVMAAPKPVSDFRLTDQNGRPRTLASLRGEPTLIFFGFTHCPDVCPAALTKLKLLHESDGGTLRAVRIVLISVDGERDSPAVMKKYLASFSLDFIGLTGNPRAVADIAARFSAVAFKENRTRRATTITSIPARSSCWAGMDGFERRSTTRRCRTWRPSCEYCSRKAAADRGRSANQPGAEASRPQSVHALLRNFLRESLQRRARRLVSRTCWPLRVAGQAVLLENPDSPGKTEPPMTQASHRLRIGWALLLAAMASRASAQEALTERSYAADGAAGGIVILQVNWGRYWKCGPYENAQLQRLQFRRLSVAGDDKAARDWVLEPTSVPRSPRSRNTCSCCRPVCMPSVASS